MYRSSLLVLALVFMTASSGAALESGTFCLREDFGSEPLSDCTLQYYYYIPCPTYSWFHQYWDWDFCDKLGVFFTVGDISMQTGIACDPLDCHYLETLRVLDFAGYGTTRPPLYQVEFDVYCSDEYGCPVGPSLWNSGPYQTDFAWNYVVIDPPLCVTPCSVDPGSPPSAPRLLIVVTHTSPYDVTYPAWGFDNVSWPVELGCDMHDISCLPAPYPRPYFSEYSTIHSGFYGPDFIYCPPQWFVDPEDSMPDASRYGYLELAWRIYLVCSGPTDVQPSTWGNVKSMYK